MFQQREAEKLDGAGGIEKRQTRGEKRGELAFKDCDVMGTPMLYILPVSICSSICVLYVI